MLNSGGFAAFAEMPDAASSGEQGDVEREGEFHKSNLHEQLSADEQIGRADSLV